MDSSLVIAQRKGLKWYAGIVAFSIVILVVVFILGMWVRSGQYAEVKQALEVSQELNQVLSAQIEKQTEQLNEQHQNLSVNGAQTQHQITAIKTLQQELKETTEELNFYRRIIAPNEGEKGLKIVAFEQKPQQGQSRALAFTLIQAGTIDRWIAGELSYVIVGKNAEDEIIELPQNNKAKQDKLTFRFRYFKTLTTAIDLPEGFQPTQVKVKAVSKGRKPQTIEQVYPWNEA